MKPKIKSTRREFFSNMGRIAGLAGIVGLVGYLSHNRKIDYSNISCVNNGYCRLCKILDKCEQPEAVEEKALL